MATHGALPLPFFGSAHHGRRGGSRRAGAAGAAAVGGTPAALGGEVGDISVARKQLPLLGAGDHLTAAEQWPTVATEGRTGVEATGARTVGGPGVEPLGNELALLVEFIAGFARMMWAKKVGRWNKLVESSQVF